jgi:Spy/CpxP family protein refolding chaperone
VNSWKIILPTVVIFGAGVLTGGLLVDHVQRPHFESHRSVAPAHSGGHRTPGLPPPRSEMLNQEFVSQLNRSLHLTPVQRQKITKIIAAGQERNHDLWKLVSPQFRAVMQDTHEHIRAVLTPEQRKQFEELLKQFRSSGRHPADTNAPPANAADH